MKRLKIPLTLSLCIHGLFAAILFLGAYSLYETETGGAGSGGIVSVWIAGHDGDSVGESDVRRPRAGRRSPARSPSSFSFKPDKADEGSSGSEASYGRAQTTGTGGGEGVGSGQGAGIGSGSGGNPVLAKIWKRINRSKYYPETAKSRGLEGSPRVTFTISEDGSVESVSLASSCGEGLLDDAARETIRRAAPLPFYPGPITLTVKYSLAD